MSGSSETKKPAALEYIFANWKQRLVSVGRVALGSIFIVSGVMKALDAQSFMATLPFYQLPDWLLPPGALVPTIEVSLGIALLMGLATRFIALASLGMLAFFTVLLILGIAGGELDTCGCFGRLLEQSPGSALVRNIVLMLIAGVVWYFNRRSRVIWHPWKVATVGATLLIVGTVTGYTIHAPQLDTSLARVGHFFPDEGITDETGPELEGRQLVFVFAVSCEHCWNTVANVNVLAQDTSYTLFAVTNSDPYEVDWFREEFGATFPIYYYDPSTFSRAFRVWPALYYLEDGLIMGKTEYEVPALRTLEEVYLPKWQ
ncbi:MAG: DoxX family protein [Fidelibacterota bacterium]|nr:MAG: DoxX family protein [Candidatus Neomarinimicrobiota bacterium]